MVAAQIGVSGMKVYVLKPGQTIETGLSTKCLLLSTNDSTSIYIGAHLIYYNGEIKEIVPNTRLSYGVDISEKVCILVSNHEIIIKNNYTSDQVISIYTINLWH